MNARKKNKNKEPLAMPKKTRKKKQKDKTIFSLEYAVMSNVTTHLKYVHTMPFKNSKQSTQIKPLIYQKKTSFCKISIFKQTNTRQHINTDSEITFSNQNTTQQKKN